ncbi:uncharacterized protein [Dermacentor albipictus]|uniref:uncharacterized protein n=1 Tax=Dermacentor albipictus TaxID=60249 RepID=UPI0038FC887E
MILLRASPVCKVPYTSNFNYYGDMESAFTFNPDMMRTVTYDTDATLKKKVCTLKAAQQKTNFGIAAFDIDCDVATMPCAELYLKDGAFTRLKTLGGLRNYISKGLLNKHECLAASV